MTSRAARRRRRSRWNQGLVVLVAAVAGLVAAAAGSPRGGGGDAAPVEAGDGTGAAEPVPNVAALGHLDADGALDMLVILGFVGEQAGNAVLVPPSTFVDVPSLGTQRIGDVVRFGSDQLLEIALENSFGVAIDELVLLDDAQLASAFAVLPRLTVDLAGAVRVDDEAGTIGLPRGKHEIDTSAAVRMLVGTEAAGELAHQVTVRALLEAWRVALGDERAASATVATEPRLRGFVERAGLELRYDTLPVEAVSVGGGETRFSLRRDDAARLLRAAFSESLLNGGEPRPRVEIRNGTGTVGLTPLVAALVVPVGAEVTLTGNVPGFGVVETQVVYYDAEDRAPATRLAEVLGVPEVRRARERVSVVDVTIVVGEDFSPPG